MCRSTQTRPIGLKIVVGGRGAERFYRSQRERLGSRGAWRAGVFHAGRPFRRDECRANRGNVRGSFRLRSLMFPQPSVRHLYPGSTGTPKGVQMEHHSVLNLVESHKQRFGDQLERRHLGFARGVRPIGIESSGRACGWGPHVARGRSVDLARWRGPGLAYLRIPCQSRGVTARLHHRSSACESGPTHRAGLVPGG